MAELERALVVVKPAAVARGRAGDLVRMLERRGLRIAALERVEPDEARTLRLYGRWARRRFFEELVAFNSSGPVIALVVEGRDAARAARALVGATDPLAGAPGTMRGRFGVSFPANVVHATHESGHAAREIAVFWAAAPGR